MTLINSISQGSFLKAISGAGAGSGGGSSIGGQGASASFDNGDILSLSSGLSNAAQAFSQSFLRLGNPLSVLNETKQNLEELLSISEKLLKLAEKASDPSATGEERNRLNSKYQLLINDFKEVVSNSSNEDFDFLDKQDLSDSLKSYGIDPTSATVLAQALTELGGRDANVGTELLTSAAQEAALNASAAATVTSNGTAASRVFSDATSLTTSSGPQGVAVVDIDNDSNLDLVNISDGGGGSDLVNTMLGVGDGTFGTNTTSNTAGTVKTGGIATGDFDEDGFADLAFTSDGSGANADKLQISISDGDGNYQTPIELQAGTDPVSVTIADFDNDDNLDVVTADSGADSVTVFLGDGTGGFATGVSYAVGSTPSEVRTADFNKDGNADIVTSDQAGNTVSVLLGTGTGTFGTAASYAVGQGPSSVATGDFNGDSNPDIAATNSTDDTISILLGDGSGTSFTAGTSLSTGTTPESLVAADLDLDGKLDLISGNTGDDSISVFFGNGNGTFVTPTTLSAGTAPSSLAVGDFDENNAVDIVSVADGGTQLDVFSQTNADSIVPEQTPVISSNPLNTSLTSRGRALAALSSIGDLIKNVKEDLELVNTVIIELDAAREFARVSALAFDEAGSTLSSTATAQSLAERISSKIRNSLKDTSLGAHSDLDRELAATLLG